LLISQGKKRSWVPSGFNIYKITRHYLEPLIGLDLTMTIIPLGGNFSLILTLGKCMQHANIV